MAGAKLPPRQKMIGMMYLVLTALLALNVSKDILDAFIIVNDGIETSTRSFANKNELLYYAFDAAAVESKAAAPFRDKAYVAKAEADELYGHIELLKRHLIKATEGLDANADDSLFRIENVKEKDNYDIPTHELGLADPALPQGGEWSAIDLKMMINAYQKALEGLFETEEDRKSLMASLSVLETPDFGMKDGVLETWESGNFYRVPLAAVITLLSKIQADVRSAEAEVVARLYENIEGKSIPFNRVDGFAFAKRNFVLEGDSFEAQIFTAAYDDRQAPEIFIGAYDQNAINSGVTDIEKIMIGTRKSDHTFNPGEWYQLEDVEGGKGRLKIKPPLGIHEWGGVIRYTTSKGVKIFPFQNSFEVGRPSTTIAATNMNVLYIGVANPISISAPVPQEHIKASGLGIRRDVHGNWVVNPRQQGIGRIMVSADIDGRNTALGSMEFRVKKMPDPKPYVAGITGFGRVSRAQAGAIRSVQAKMENFVFKVEPEVLSFVMVAKGSDDVLIEIPNQGGRLNEASIRVLNRVRPGQRIYFENIKAKMPDQTTRTLPTVTLKVAG